MSVLRICASAQHAAEKLLDGSVRCAPHNYSMVIQSAIDDAVSALSRDLNRTVDECVKLKAELDAARAEIESKSTQIGNLYRVCEEKAALSVELSKARADCAEAIETLKTLGFACKKDHPGQSILSDLAALRDRNEKLERVARQMLELLHDYNVTCNCGGQCGGGFSYPKCKKCHRADDLELLAHELLDQQENKQC